MRCQYRHFENLDEDRDRCHQQGKEVYLDVIGYPGKIYRVRKENIKTDNIEDFKRILCKQHMINAS